jgi:hypothetical protein
MVVEKGREGERKREVFTFKGGRQGEDSKATGSSDIGQALERHHTL